MKKTLKRMTRIEAMEYLESHGQLSSAAIQRELAKAQKKEEAREVREQTARRKVGRVRSKEKDEAIIEKAMKEGRFLAEPKVAKGSIFGDPVADIEW